MNEGDLLGTWLEAFIQMFPRVIFPLNSWRLSTTSVSPHFLVYVASLPYPPPGLFHLHLNVYCGPSTKSSASKEGGKAQRSKESHVSVLLCVPASLLQMNVCMCVSFPSTKVLKVLCKTAPNWTHGKTQKKRVWPLLWRYTFRHKWHQISTIYWSVHTSSGMWPHKHFWGSLGFCVHTDQAVSKGDPLETTAFFFYLGVQSRYIFTDIKYNHTKVLH